MRPSIKFLALVATIIPTISSAALAPAPAPLQLGLGQRQEPWWNALHEVFIQEASLYPKFILYGDSITETWRGTKAGLPYPARDDNAAVFKQLFPNSTAAFGISGDQTLNLLWRLKNGELVTLDNTTLKHQPRVVVLLIGTNDLGVALPTSNTTELIENSDNTTATLLQTVPSIKKNVKTIINYIHETAPLTGIVLMGLLPRTYITEPANNFSYPSIFTSAINEVNLSYQRIANKDCRITYLDCSDLFLSSDRTMLNQELLPDGLHPNGEAGADTLAGCIIPAMKSLLASGRTATVQQHNRKISFNHEI